MSVYRNSIAEIFGTTCKNKTLRCAQVSSPTRANQVVLTVSQGDSQVDEAAGAKIQTLVKSDLSSGEYVRLGWDYGYVMCKAKLT